MTTNQKTLLSRYQYDPLDRLADCESAGQTITRRFYLKDRLTTEIQGSVQRSIFQQHDQLLAQRQHQDSTVETALLATDQQRSVLQLLDATQPHPLAYTPYGHRPAENGLLSLLGFNGERPDPVTGHYLLGNGYRAFNPVLMRFNSPDRRSPFDKGGVNAYAYASGNPVNYTDPTGEFALSILAPIQRALIIALHSIVPAGMILGPKVKGAALWATRVSLSGSAGSALGAAMQLAGSPIGAYVSAAGTAALIGGAATRGVLALRATQKGGPLWEHIKGNVRRILGFSKKEKPPVKIPETGTPNLPSSSPSVTISIPDDLNQTAGSIRGPRAWEAPF
jgi:RHS repeat-associated protein